MDGMDGLGYVCFQCETRFVSQFRLTSWTCHGHFTFRGETAFRFLLDLGLLKIVMLFREQKKTNVKEGLKEVNEYRY